jgi:RND family efflux transporter MFP subunit
MYRSAKILVLAVLLLLSSQILEAEEKRPKGPPPLPPAKVVVAELKAGMVAPQAEYIGTVYFQEVSTIAAEVSGRVEEVGFEDGQTVKTGFKLVKIDSEILEKSLLSTKAAHSQVGANLERARIDFARIKKLYSQKLVPDRDYDEHRFGVKAIERQAASIEADVQRLKAELKKKSIETPYDSVVIKRHVDRGEWLSPGSPVATIAKVDFVDIVVNVPERAVRFTKSGMVVAIEAGGHKARGKVVAVIPSGDVATRTFPVKVRVRNDISLKEGMEARVRLPIGERTKALVIHRDALITKFGRTAVYAVMDSKAVMVPVQVVGYDGASAGIRGKGIEDGTYLVVKGNERIKDGQPVQVVGGRGPGKGR